MSANPTSSSPLRIMLVDDDPLRTSAVENSLRTCGYEEISIISATSALLFQIEQHRPDIVLIDLRFPGRDILESLAVVNRHNPTPMVMFTEEDDPAYIRQAFKAGICSYMMEGINTAKVKPVIDVALAQFSSFQAMKSELEEARSELDSQKKIGRAKALLMKFRRIDEAAAHKTLLQMAMDNNLKMGDVATMVISTLGNEQGKKV